MGKRGAMAVTALSDRSDSESSPPKRKRAAGGRKSSSPPRKRASGRRERSSSPRDRYSPPPRRRASGRSESSSSSRARPAAASKKNEGGQRSSLLQPGLGGFAETPRPAGAPSSLGPPAATPTPAHSTAPATTVGANPSIAPGGPELFMSGLGNSPGMPGVAPGMPGVAPGMIGVTPGVPGQPGVSAEPKVATTQIDFANLNANNGPAVQVNVPRQLAQDLMTPENKKILLAETGASVQWSPLETKVLLRGSQESVKNCQRILQRVVTHCRWGFNDEKVKFLLKPSAASSVMCRLSPIGISLPAKEKVLSGIVHSPGTRLSIGKDASNDLTIDESFVSRTHVVLEFDPEKGAVYAFDCSTNGTFLNGVQLPAKKSGKVLMWHGDELLLKDPKNGGSEFGYIVNIDVRGIKDDLKLDMPRRLLTADDSSHPGNMLV